MLARVDIPNAGTRLIRMRPEHRIHLADLRVQRLCVGTTIAFAHDEVELAMC